MLTVDVTGFLQALVGDQIGIRLSSNDAPAAERGMRMFDYELGYEARLDITLRPIPLPPALLLFGSSMLVLGGFAQRIRR